ncbi:MAG TPA: hypothetical protein VKE88_02695 [Candidatus Nanoarchaeia archaeon]|nr:hypothetical protein [Candidatus Nanoarchaeia archaeon]
MFGLLTRVKPVYKIDYEPEIDRNKLLKLLPQPTKLKENETLRWSDPISIVHQLNFAFDTAFLPEDKGVCILNSDGTFSQKNSEYNGLINAILCESNEKLPKLGIKLDVTKNLENIMRLGWAKRDNKEDTPGVEVTSHGKIFGLGIRKGTLFLYRTPNHANANIKGVELEIREHTKPDYSGHDRFAKAMGYK